VLKSSLLTTWFGFWEFPKSAGIFINSCAENHILVRFAARAGKNPARGGKSETLGALLGRPAFLINTSCGGKSVQFAEFAFFAPYEGLKNFCTSSEENGPFFRPKNGFL